MVHQDGFLTSHTQEIVHPLSDEAAFNFIGEFKPMRAMLDFEKPITYGAQTEEEWHFEHKANQNAAIFAAETKIAETFAEFEKLTGRKYDLVESYKLEDADEVVVAIGSVTGTLMLTIDKLRAEGKKAGLLAIRMLRPFPRLRVADALKNAKSVAILDRCAPMGTTGILFNEIAAVLADNGKVIPMLNYIYGLGGRDTTVSMLEAVYKDLAECSAAGKRVKPLMQHINLRGKTLTFF
jgi:pyruvate ferredoxin oxidoreductase alpha subunit